MSSKAAAVTASAAAASSSSGESKDDFLKYALIAGGATAVAIAVAYVLFGGQGKSEEKKKKKKKQAEAQVEPKISPLKTAKKTEAVNKVVMEDIPDEEDVEEVTARKRDSNKNTVFFIVFVFLQITDPFEKAMAVKNKGNKYFRGGRYQKAIECYTKALEHCPADRGQDMATFYQNRAAAHDQLVRNQALYLNA